MIALPASLINVDGAVLSAVYQDVIAALVRCVEIDECKEWIDKAAALASYAKQAGDPRLRNYAMRIQGRAVKRCGQLLDQYDGRGRPPENTVVAHGNLSQREAADAAGLSEHQQLQAVRVARVPDALFDGLVEAETPATVTQLAELGRRAIERPPPPGFKHATNLIDLAEKLARFCKEHEPEEIATGILDHEAVSLAADLATIDAWAGKFLEQKKMAACREN